VKDLSADLAPVDRDAFGQPGAVYLEYSAAGAVERDLLDAIALAEDAGIWQAGRPSARDFDAPEYLA